MSAWPCTVSVAATAGGAVVGAVAACVGRATIARVAVSLRISAVARALRAHAVCARVHAWIATVSAVDDRAQVFDAVGAVSVADFCSGRLAALCDHPRWIPSKLSVHPDEGGVHAIAEQHGLGGSHRGTATAPTPPLHLVALLAEVDGFSTKFSFLWTTRPMFN